MYYERILSPRLKMVAFAQIMAIWTPGKSLEDHLNPFTMQGNVIGANSDQKNRTAWSYVIF